MDDEEVDTLDPLERYRKHWSQFGKKTYGRIWVADEKYVKAVDAICKELDGFEHGYMPRDFIAVYAGELYDVVYGHKFELNYHLLTQVCWSRGIWITCVTDMNKD